MGIHYADLLEYFLGPVASVMGMNAVVDAERIDAQGNRHPADAEDLSAGVARYAGGALAHWLLNEAGRGERLFQRIVHGTGGSLNIPRDRSGQKLLLSQRHPRPNAVGQDEIVPDDGLLDLVPDFALDDVTAALFGGERLAAYEMAFADIDANLLGVEQHDLAAAILSGREPEVTGADGLRSLALVLGFLESDVLGRAVTLDEMLTREDMPYQAQIET
jgi:predicted dehydrogenase